MIAGSGGAIPQGLNSGSFNEMNKKVTKYLLSYMILMICGWFHAAFSQSRYDSSFNEAAEKFAENLVVFTDRTLYSVNESVRFAAILQSGEGPYQGLGSKVVYAELVGSNGNVISGGKYLVSDNQASGYLSIPQSAPSGNYFMRCYTLWMRNFGAQNFAYIPIRVVNPHTANVDVYRGAGHKKELVSGQTFQEGLNCETSKKSYSPGETVDLRLSITSGLFPIDHCCITVVPSGSIGPPFLRYKLDPGMDEPITFAFDFLPEIYGPAISGRVVERTSGKAVSGSRVHFSILGEHPAYFATIADEDGTFIVNAPSGTGVKEMFVAAESQPGIPVEVRIDNHFAPDPLPFQPASFSLGEEEFAMASRISLHAQLQQAFKVRPDTDHMEREVQKEFIPFFGKPQISVRMDDFINLPNMEEVFENLIPMAGIFRTKGIASFRINSDNPNISWLPILVLVDHIPIFDAESILALPPSKVDRIEVVPEVYVRGKIKFGGIINITTQSGDLAGTRLPEGSYFFDFSAIHSPAKWEQETGAEPGPVPDTRNTLLWLDHIKLTENKSFTTNFNAGAVPGKYVILIRGLTPGGEVVYGLSSFLVD